MLLSDNVPIVNESTRSPTLHDVAKLAGFGTSTTSRALGNYGRVAPDTRDKVMAAANELGYRRNNLARSLITGRTETIGVVCADMASPFFAEALRGISDYSREHGFSMLIVNTDEDLVAERDAIALLRDKQVDGIIVAPADVQRVEHLADFQRDGSVVVLLDRSSSEIDADSVTVDDVAAMTNGVENLIRAGHRRIGIVTELRLEREADWQTLLADNLEDVDRRTLNPSSRRLLGYLYAHRNLGIPVDPKLVARTGSHTVFAAREATLALFRNAEPTALITVDNSTSVGAFGAIRQLGIRVPEDVSFIGFDNLDWTTLVTPAISVIEQPVHELGKMAARMIIDRLRGDNVMPTHDVALETRFVPRGSIRRI